MAGITTLALLSLSAAKTGINYSNQRKAAKATEREADYSAGILEQNAGYAREQAADALTRGHEAELDTVRGQRQLHGAQRAAGAAAGIDINSGSARDVQTNDERMALEEERRIRNNAAREAHGFQVQGDDYLAQAQLTRVAGQNQAKALRRQSMSTLLSGAGELASTYASLRETKIRRGGRWQGNKYDGDYTAAGYRRGGEL